MDEKAAFGQWLRERRKALRLTQEELAERIACSGAMVRKIEAGERSASQPVAELLADAFGVVASERSAFVLFARGQMAMDVARRKLWQTLHSRQAHPTNLVAPLTSLIGREQDLHAVQTLLLRGSHRLVTLTGPPGIGKTRLGLQAAIELLDHFVDGVFFVSLASVTDPDQVLAEIEHQVGSLDKPAREALDNLQESVGKKQMLLLLDNFEQVLDASLSVIELLGTCPNLKVIVTSREALHVTGEQQFHVPALETADVNNLPPIEMLQNVPTVSLFLERAQAVKPDFALAEENAKAVAAICAGLEGLPLAIEIAAARIRLLSPQEIRERLDSRLPLLTGGPRNLPPRQRTLRAAIDWSYNLLSREEQTLFARLGAFVGGFTLAAAEAVCGGGDSEVLPDSRQVVSFDVSQGIESLLDKNLLKQQEGVSGAWRFSMLELIREYALEKLWASGEGERTRNLHAAHFRKMAAEADPELMGAHQREWVEKLEQEKDNLRGAMRWLLNSDDSALALELAGSIGGFLQIRGYHKETREWLEEALAQGKNAPALVRARALRVLADMAQVEGDHWQAVEWGKQSLDLYMVEDYLPGVTSVLHTLAMSALHQGELERAIALANEGLAVGIDSTMPIQTMLLLYVLAGSLWSQGDFQQAEDFAEKAAALSREVGGPDSQAGCYNLLGLIAHYRGDHGNAEAYYLECISIAGQLGAQLQIVHGSINLACLALAQGDYERAAPLLGESLRTFVELGDKEGIAEGLEGFAWLAQLENNPERAVRLFASAARIRDEFALPLPSFMGTNYEQLLGNIRPQIGDDAFTSAQSEGRAMTTEQAVKLAQRKE